MTSCHGLAVEGDVVVGDPSGELILASEDLDLLVLGSRRWGPVKRLALGSTSERVIRHTACPVLIPPRLETAEDAHGAGPGQG
jgi:nucleotide-binding universal stress UspA family protein